MSVVSKIPRPLKYVLIALFFGLVLLSFSACTSQEEKPIASIATPLPTRSRSLTPYPTNPPMPTSETTAPSPTLFPSPTEIQPSPTTQLLSDNLDLTIRFSSLGIQITNNESLELSDCLLNLNPGLIRSGYTYQIKLISAGDTFPVLFDEFTKSDGTRFNYYDTKPKDLFIVCTDTSGNSRDNYYLLE